MFCLFHSQYFFLPPLIISVLPLSVWHSLLRAREEGMGSGVAEGDGGRKKADICCGIVGGRAFSYFPPALSTPPSLTKNTKVWR